MIEQAFTQKIRRENRWKWITAAVTAPLCVVLVYGHLCIAMQQGMIQEPVFPYLFFVQALIIILASGVSWAMRDAQRHDLYSVVTGMSVTQLRRFRGEMDDEIERLETGDQFQDLDKPKRGRPRQKEDAA